MARLDDYIGKEIEVVSEEKEISVQEAAQFLLEQLACNGCLSPCGEYEGEKVCNCCGPGLVAIQEIANDGYNYRGVI